MSERKIKSLLLNKDTEIFSSDIQAEILESLAELRHLKSQNKSLAKLKKDKVYLADAMVYCAGKLLDAGWCNFATYDLADTARVIRKACFLIQNKINERSKTAKAQALCSYDDEKQTKGAGRVYFNKDGKRHYLEFRILEFPIFHKIEQISEDYFQSLANKF